MKTLLNVVYYIMLAWGVATFVYTFGTRHGRHTLRAMIRPRWVWITMLAEIPLAALVLFLFKRYHVTDHDLHNFTSWMGLIGIVLLILGIVIRLIRGRNEAA